MWRTGQGQGQPQVEGEAFPSTKKSNMIKVATWNLCLGLKSKKDYVYDTLRKENIDICVLQEVEINKAYPLNILTAKDYKLERLERLKRVGRKSIKCSGTKNFFRKRIA